jgi:hypothetical protein
MATEFAVDLGGIATPANIESPIVNEAGSKAISGLGTAAHLKFANDNEDAALQLRSAQSGSTALTESELKAIQYPQLQAALDQGLFTQDEFQARLDANLRRVYAAFPGRAKAYASFANGVRATLAPDSGGGRPQNDAEAIERARLDALHQSEQRKFELANDLNQPREVVDNLVRQKTRLDYETNRINNVLAQGRLEGREVVEAGLDSLPVWTGAVFENIVADMRKTGGTIPPGQEGVVLFRAMSTYDSAVENFLKKAPPGSDMSEFREASNKRREGIRLFIENMGAEKVATGERNTTLAILGTHSARIFEELYMANLAGGQEAVKGLLDSYRRPELEDIIFGNNQAYKNYKEKSGKDGRALAENIRIKLYGGGNEPLTKEEEDVVQQGGVNAVAGPNFRDNPPKEVIEATTRAVGRGDIRSVKAWFTPQGNLKLTSTGEAGDFYREQFKRSMDSVVASTVTELAHSTGEIRLSPSGHGFEFVPSDIGTALHTAARVFGLGSTEIDRKIDLLSKYAEQHPNMVLGGSGSAAEARAQLLEDINKRVERVRAGRVGDTRAPTSTTPTGTTPPSGDVINIDDNGDPIQ